MTEMFDDDLLHDYMQGFYGYGNYAGRYWFRHRGGRHRRLSRRQQQAGEPPLRRMVLPTLETS
jgi:hypothetical protein